MDSEAARGLPPRVYVPLVLLFGAAVIAVMMVVTLMVVLGVMLAFAYGQKGRRRA